MRKTTLSKLTLNRETLLRLNETQMQGVAGAAPSNYQYSQCDSCGIACTVYTCPARSCGCPEA